jgi:hypothetical protein
MFGGEGMDEGKGWMGCGTFDLGAQSARGGGLRCGSGKKAKKKEVLY